MDFTDEIAQLVGALFADGSLELGKKNHYYGLSFSVGDQRDVEDLVKDLTTIGGYPHVRNQKKTFSIAGRVITMNTFQVRCGSKELFLTFKGLGVPVGKKSNQEYSVPSWIMHGSLTLQKRFLSGFLDGDGPVVTIDVRKRPRKEDYNTIRINDVEFYNRIDLVNNGVLFAHQLCWLLEKQGVVINKVFNKGEFSRKSGTVSTSVHITLSTTIESALAYGEIGFAYCHHKSERMRKVQLFLERLAYMRKMWREKHATALNLYNTGSNLKSISRDLDISYETIFGWVKQGKNPTVNYHKLKFDKWGENNVNA